MFLVNGLLGLMQPSQTGSAFMAYAIISANGSEYGSGVRVLVDFSC